MLGEDAAVIVFFLVLRRVDREPLGGMGHLLVGNCRCCNCLQGIYPRIPHPIAELLFLSPCHLGGQHIGESLTHNTFLHGRARTHLRLGVDTHRYIKKRLVEEGHTSFHPPCRQTLVGTKTVVEVEFGKFAHGFLVERPCRRGFVEIEITTEDLIGTFTGKHHLDAHRFDDTGQQVHRRRGTDGSHVISLDEVDDIAQGIKPFLDSIIDFMMYGAYVVGHKPGLCQVGRPFQSHGKRMETGPVGPCAGFVLDAHLTVFLGNGRDDRRVEATAEQHAIGHVGHQLPSHRVFERIMDI